MTKKWLKLHKSRVVDDIDMDITKPSGIPYLARLFNVSINNATIPKDWKSDFQAFQTAVTST